MYKLEAANARRVLVIDGEASRRRSMRRYLTEAGLDVVDAPAANIALQAAAGGAFDLVVVNSELPDMPGLEVCRRLKSTPETCHLPVLHTGATDQENTIRARTLESGADAFLTLPLDPVEFIAQTCALLRVREIEKAREAAERQLERQKSVLAERNKELRETIQALRENERRYRLLFDRNPDAVFSLDAKGNFTLYNPACLQMTGCSSEQLQGMNFRALCAPESVKVWGETFAALVIGRMDRAELEISIRRKVGSAASFWVTTETNRVEGRVSEIHCTAKDITNRKHAEDELRRTQERMRLHLENSPLGLIEFGVGGEIVSWTGGATRIFGWKADEVIGKTVWDLGLVHPDDVPSVRHLFLSMSTGMSSRVTHINRNVRKDGQVVWCEWYNSIVGEEEQSSGEAAKSISLLSLVLDISIRKQAEEKARSAAAQDHYRIRLSDTLRGLSNPVEIQAAAARFLGEAIGAHRVHYGEVIEDGKISLVLADWCNGLESAVGKHNLDDSSPVLMKDLRRGATIVVEDVATDPRLTEAERQHTRKMTPGAYVVLPLIKSGQLISLLAVHQRTPRKWTEKEIQLIHETAERTWAIVERARAEAELRRSESFYRQTLESMPGMVFTTRPDGWCDYQNHEWIDYTGVPLRDHLGSGWNKLLHPEDQPRAMKAWRAAVSGKCGYDLEYRVRRHDGVYEWFKAVARPIRDHDGRVVRWFGTAMNIERLKQAEQALTESEKRLRLAQESGGVGVYDVDLARHRITWTGQLERLYGIEAPDTFEDCVAAWRSLVHPEDLQRLDREQQSWMESGLNESSTEYRMLRPDGTCRWIGVKATAIRDEDGRVVRVVGTNTDITERKAFEEELERLVVERTKELQRTNEQLNAFCYSIAHDLKAPLRAQTAFANLLEEEFGTALGELGRSYAHRIAEAAQRQNKLVADLLSHMSITRADLPLSGVDLAQIVRETQTDLELEISSRNASITVQPLQLNVIANAASLHLVVQNLLSNALKFVEPGRKPHVQVWEQALESAGRPRVRLWVGDNGIGIDPKYHDRIFGMFQRLHTEKAFPGTGMGLAIVRRAVERMGGRVGLESPPGGGCRFWIELDRAPAQGPLSSPESTRHHG